MLKSALKSSPIGPFLINVKRSPRMLNGIVDRWRLSSVLTEMGSFVRRSEARSLGLKRVYEEYISTISLENTAVSIETAGFLSALMEKVKPRSAVDLGSGFSSYVLRDCARRRGLDTQIWSVDDEAKWLERTKEFLLNKSVSTDGVITWDEFKRTATPKSMDFIFYDLGIWKTRFQELRTAASFLAEGGWLVLDDTHRPGYLPLIREVFSGRHRYSLHALTEDKYTRFAYLIH